MLLSLITSKLEYKRITFFLNNSQHVLLGGLGWLHSSHLKSSLRIFQFVKNIGISIMQCGVLGNLDHWALIKNPLGVYTTHTLPAHVAVVRYGVGVSASPVSFESLALTSGTLFTFFSLPQDSRIDA